MSDSDGPTDHSQPPPDRGISPTSEAGESVSAPSSPQRELVLVKRGQRFVFRCDSGEEASLLARLRDLANDPEVELSWFDAAVLSHQVGQRLSRQLKVKQPPAS